MIINFMLARYTLFVHLLRQQTSIAKPVRKLTTSDAIAMLSGNVQISSIMAMIMQNQQHATNRIGIITARMEPMIYDSFLFILLCPTTYIWFPDKTLYLTECQYNTPFSKVYTHIISYSFPNTQAHRRQWSVAELPSGAAPC